MGSDIGDPGEAPTLPNTPDPSSPPARRDARPQLSKYEPREVIGRGGMGEVVLAHDTAMDRDVALKRMRGVAPSADAIARFLREARIQARLDHPAVVPVHDLGLDAEGQPYFTMKRLAGTTLADVMASGTATLQRQLRAIVDVCYAIELAHVRRIVHRDLKPSNIMLGDYGEVYVLDWGVARVLDGAAHDTRPASERIPSLGGETATGELLGTPGYMAPEQARGEDVGPAADVYALGAILFEILAGIPLHPRGPQAIASTLGSVETSPAARTDRPIPPELDAACVAALGAAPDDRPSARALGDRLQAYLDGDRDLERRRALAAKLVASGREALAAGHRAEAVHLGGRALALDPSSDDAAALVVSLVIDPPDEMPAELQVDLDKAERQQRKATSRRALTPFGVAYLFLPMLAFVGIASWPAVIALYVAATVVGVIAYVNSRTARVPIGVFLLAWLVLVVTFSRMSGPFVLTPAVICGIALSATGMRWLNERRLAVAAYIALIVVAPFVLEWTGVLAPTWTMTGDGVLSRGSVFQSRDSVVPLFIGNLVLTLLVAWFARGISEHRRRADERLLLQRWHLLQLLPKSAAARARGSLTASH